MGKRGALAKNCQARKQTSFLTSQSLPAFTPRLFTFQLLGIARPKSLSICSLLPMPTATASVIYDYNDDNPFCTSGVVLTTLNSALSQGDACIARLKISRKTEESLRLSGNCNYLEILGERGSVGRAVRRQRRGLHNRFVQGRLASLELACTVIASNTCLTG